MKKLILTLIYPFWLFLAKTFIGNMIMVVVTVLILPLLLSIIAPDIMFSTSDEAKFFGVGVGILSMLFAPIIANLLFNVSYDLERYYSSINYKVKI